MHWWRISKGKHVSAYRLRHGMYGSFMGYDVLTEIQSDQATKKARLSGETEVMQGPETHQTSEESDSLKKLQTDYMGSGSLSPNLTPIDRGTVGPVPPPVP
ncbi:unnamed protein product [Microthlaspi erraticum]|uniref:Uncharacterized protein n=1 Tax=Microthlaspi erraticum TaxID=1685480 RepID=A0A6D2J4U3_9BRAS|nr:unnamed protein product [Microthlaspi erraticum]CAA7038094.1 unnamed protein product [Microthlaspi erraticum]CAA7056508.1 unnamed protein product [Microthlaspi erraticum]